MTRKRLKYSHIPKRTKLIRKLYDPLRRKGLHHWQIIPMVRSKLHDLNIFISDEIIRKTGGRYQPYHEEV